MEQIDRLRELMQIETNVQVQQVNEGFWDNVKTATAGVRGGISGAVKGFGQGAVNGSNIGKIDVLYKQATNIFTNFDSILRKSDKLFDQLEEYKNKINSLNIDQLTKDKYTDLISGLQQTKSDVFAAVQKQVNGTTAFDAGQKAQAQQQTRTSTPQPESEPRSSDTQGTGAKVFDINTGEVQSEIDDFLNQRKNQRSAMNEAAQLLDEAQKEGKFHEVFKVLFRNADKMAAIIQSPDMDQAALATMMKLAFRSIHDQGQATFVNNIKDINNGYNAYKSAHKNLKNKQPNQSTQGTQNTQTNQNTGQDRTAEARKVAGEFLRKHGYEMTPENLQKATQYILQHKDF